MEAAKPIRTPGQERLVAQARALMDRDPSIGEAVSRARADVQAGRDVSLTSIDELIAESDPNR